jgi:hypothetical protein
MERYITLRLTPLRLTLGKTTSVLPALPTLPQWTKSLRDSLELTALVMLRGMRWYAALDRGWNVVPSRMSSLTDGRDRRTLFAWKERANTILILHEPCHSAASARACHL